MLKYNMCCNDGKVFSPKRYDMSNRFKRTDNSTQELRTAYWKTPNRQRFREKCISTPSPPSWNSDNQKKKRRVKEREISTGNSFTAEGGKDKRKAVIKSHNCKQREEADIEEVLKKLQKLSKLVRTSAADSHLGVEGSSRFREFYKAKSSIDGIWENAFAYREKKCRRLGDEVSLEYVQGVVKDNRTDGFCCYLAQFDYGLTLPLRNFAKSVMNLIGVCPAQLNCNFWEVIFVCETLNGRWAASGSEMRITAKDFLEYYAVKYITTTNGINCNVSRKESFIDVVAREGTELEAVLKELEISRFRRVASKDDKVRRSQAKRRLVGKTPGSMEEKLTTSELNIPLMLARLNEILDGPVDMATVSSTIVQNLAKRKAEMLEESDKIAEGADLRPRLEVEADLVEEQCRAKAREKMVAVMDEEFKKFARTLRDVQLGSQDRSMELEKKISQLEWEKNQLEKKLTRERVDFQLEREKEKETAALKLKQVRAESEAEAERLVTASAISWNNHARKLYQLRYTKAEITAFSERNYEEMEIMDEEEVEESEGGLNTAEKTDVDNQETINQKELDTVREREELTLLHNAEYAEEYEALISQYEDRLDDNVKFSLKLEEVKRQVEEKTAIILSRDLALNQHTSEPAELKEKAASSSRHQAKLAEYCIRALNKEIYDMKCNIRALNELLLKREIDLDTARTNLVVSEADFEKLSISIMGKDRELSNSEQMRDSLIARLDRLKADLGRLKGKKAQSRADFVEIQAKNQNLVDDLDHARGNVRRATQREKEMNAIINQLCAQISDLERELRVRELKYQKDLKFVLDKRDCEISSGEGSLEMKEFLRQK
ncbi:hypothetical protein GIB67_032609 [Kingdonia uniflora]|uniref:Uncharacterized protein n=1 Tax=Kingdonia uniflora TaxID=39325 RepID=A0A7J7L541_9MAGN|nr:hypothetical protein GIB67_032609 [Kingdonia uniflora]